MADVYTRAMRPRLQRTSATCATALAASTLLAASVALAAPAPADDVELPAFGTAAKTTLALLRYNRDLCDGIAGKLLDHWRGLGSTSEAQLEAIRRLVVDRELSNLTTARAASDLVDRFLPRVREEAPKKIGTALKRLHLLEIELCDTVAYPKGTREQFEAKLAVILNQIESEEADLGRQLEAKEDALQSALGPYLGHLQIAGVEAEGEYRDYLDSLRPPPKLPTTQQRMEAWHHGYAQAVLPTKRALGKYLLGRRDNDSVVIRTSCREILAAVIPLLRKDAVFEAPVPKVIKPLRRAFVELKLMASECTDGRSSEVESHYEEMQVQLSTASGLLAEFSLRP